MIGPIKISPFELWGIEKKIIKAKFNPFDEGKLGGSLQKYFSNEECDFSFEHEDWVINNS